jgi:hypothetical protein|nr:MAG TPA: hypothetical protein [Caudoviricetes sp.]
MLSALDLSKYIITKCMNDRKPISNLQLQKILYYIQVEFLQKRGIRAFSDEIEAWQFGPVVRAVYQQYCGAGSFPLRIKYEDAPEINKNDKLIIDRIVEENRDKKPWDLVEKTHAEGKAWDLTYKGGKGNKSVIPEKDIRRHG